METIIINGTTYDVTGATPPVAGLLQDLVIIQGKLEDAKMQYDIINIAKASLLEKVDGFISSGESGLVEVQENETEAETENKEEEK